VLVWLTRGHVGAAQRLHALPAWRISAVTYIELAQGCRDQAELARPTSSTSRPSKGWPSRRSCLELRTAAAAETKGKTWYRAPAATAIEHQLPVLTANVKHFGAVQGLGVEVSP
jgi:predicted nucleic acid-binding protein